MTRSRCSAGVPPPGWRSRGGRGGSSSGSSARAGSARSGSAGTCARAAKRVFKFCLEANRLSSLKRELTLFRLLQDALGDRQDIARLYEVQLEQPPYFLESEFSELGNLADWAKEQGGIAAVPMATRLDLMARVADAVAAAHSVGVLHKDLKPANILMYQGEGGRRAPKLADFGIGTVIDRSKHKGMPMTGGGFTQVVTDKHSSYTTMMYAPPEIHEGKPFTVQGDWYALGVMLYQMVAGDLNRSLAEGWERNIEDPLLREDIAACVDGDPSRRMSGSRLAQHLRTLEQRHEEKRKAEEAKRREQERVEALGRQVARRKRLYKAAMGAAVFATALLVVVSWRAVHERALRERAVIAEARRKGTCAQGGAGAGQGPVCSSATPTCPPASTSKPGCATRTRERVSRGSATPRPPRTWPCGTWTARRHGRWRRGGHRAASRAARGCGRSRCRRTACPSSPRAMTRPCASAGWTPARRSFRSPATRSRVTAVAFDRSGQRVVSGGADKTVRVWDVEDRPGGGAAADGARGVGERGGVRRRQRATASSPPAGTGRCGSGRCRSAGAAPAGSTEYAAKVVTAAGSEPTQTFRCVADLARRPMDRVRARGRDRPALPRRDTGGVAGGQGP